jgi:hypothetical protein
MAESQEYRGVPAPLEQYAQAFDPLFHTRIQRQRFRHYLAGLLLPRDRNKTLTALVGAEPIVQAQTAPVQQLQFFLSESDWDAEAVTGRRIEVLQADPLTRAHEEGVLVIDETGDRKDGTQTAHVAHQYLGSIGKIANGIVAVSSLWADERVYYPVHVCPYTPAARLPGGKHHAAFRTKPQLAGELVTAAREAGLPFRAVVADSLYGEHREFKRVLRQAGVPYVLALRASHGVWAAEQEAHSPPEAAERLRWTDADHPGDWTPIQRRFRAGPDQTWWAADLRLAGYGPDRSTRLVAATTDPGRLPGSSTWYLVTNLPLSSTDLGEVVRIYGLRQWVEQGYKHVKQEVGWADFQVRSDRAIRRHWALVCCAFSFCWWAASHASPAPPLTATPASADRSSALPVAPDGGAGEKWSPGVTGLTRQRHRILRAALLATGLASGAELA